MNLRRLLFAVFCVLPLLASSCGHDSLKLSKQEEPSSHEPSISRHDVRTSLWLGGRYLARAIHPDGKFRYLYNPANDVESTEYNLVRHAGTVYSLLELYEFCGDEDLLALTAPSVLYLTKSIETLDDMPGCRAVISEGRLKLGASALALLALVEYQKVTGDDQYFGVARDLGTFIVASQKHSGRFNHQRSYPRGFGKPGHWTSFQSEYYSGEAILALLRLHQLDPQIEWLTAACSGAEYLVYEQSKAERASRSAPDHWLVQALVELYAVRPYPAFYDHAMSIAHDMVEELNSSKRPDRSCAMATRSEGLLSAYRMAAQEGRQMDMNILRPSIAGAIAFQLSTQLSPDEAEKYPAPKRSVGGFKHSLKQSKIRIDYVQHNLSSLMHYHDWVLQDNG